MKIPRIERGDPLAASYFNRVADAVNQVQETIAANASADETTLASLIAGVGTNATVNNITVINQVNTENNTTVEGVQTIQESTEVVNQRSVVYGEASRTTSTVRVEDPDDENVYVDVERIDSVIMIGDQGDYLAFVFNNG